MASQHGRCPEDFWQWVHDQGSATRHAELEAFLAGEDFELEQPLITAAGLAIA